MTSFNEKNVQTYKLPSFHTSTSERVGNSMPLSAGMLSKSSFENNGNNHRAFLVPKTLKNRVK